MMRPTIIAAFAITAAATWCDHVAAAPLPKKVGQCANTAIREVTARFQDQPRGSAVRFENGGLQIAYDVVPELARSKDGDPVRMCLVFIPKNCPKGDNRGRVYETTNLRTKEKWKMQDSSHSCGGA